MVVPSGDTEHCYIDEHRYVVHILMKVNVSWLPNTDMEHRHRTLFRIAVPYPSYLAVTPNPVHYLESLPEI